MINHIDNCRSLEELLDYDDTDFVQVFELTFTISIASFGQLRTVELKPNGANIMVNLENKHEYVRLYVSYQLDTGLDGNIERQVYCSYSSACLE